MNTVGVFKILGDMGARYKVSELGRIMDYTTQMIEDGRVVVINKDGEEYAVMFFSLTDSPDLYLCKDTWDYVAYDPHGRYLYVEKLVSKSWNKTLRLLFEEEIIKRYPQITHGIWHRWASYGDRKVISKRRIP